MDRKRVNIAIIEPSQIIFEGVSGILLRLESNITVCRPAGIEELSATIRTREITIAIINPSVLQNRLNDFAKLKKEFPDIMWIALVYTLFSSDLLERFDATIPVTATAEEIAATLARHDTQPAGSAGGEAISQRETDVLKEMIKGHSNKEIADHLNISIHTVITHRRNITEKTGIKSLSGLTIYAISKRLVPLTYLE